MAASKPLLSNRVYDILKPVTALILPAVATLYIALGQIWGFPNPDSVAQTITAINVFLGVVLIVTSGQYKDSDGSGETASPVVGDIAKVESPEGKIGYTLQFDGDPVELLEQSQRVSFNIT